MLGSSWVTAQLAASQEGISFMKLVRIYDDADDTAASDYDSLYGGPIGWVKLLLTCDPEISSRSRLMSFLVFLIKSQ
jgi:hypothetical protein